MSNLDDFLSGYAYAILWANAYRYEGEEMVLDEDATYAYHSPGKWWEDCGIDLDDAREFFHAHWPVLWDLGKDDFAQHGHDFALTRNGHGAGFWDRGYGEVGERLTESAKVYGEHSVITDDGPTVTNF